MRSLIVVAAHKEYPMPGDELYLPLFVGADLKSEEELNAIPESYARDNTGDNISSKNRSFCELTALYWAWKNIDSDYVGLVHYRRFFSSKRSKAPLTKEELSSITRKTDVILPKKRNYFIETNYSHYAHAHHAKDLDKTRQIMCDKCPAYLASYDKTMNLTYGHRFNMLIMKKDMFDSYCKWLFNILFALEKELDTGSYTDYDKRVYGFISERLLDVWIDANQINYKELPCMFTEKENWIRKIYRFLKRKYSRQP